MYLFLVSRDLYYNENGFGVVQEDKVEKEGANAETTGRKKVIAAVVWALRRREFVWRRLVFVFSMLLRVALACYLRPML